MVRRLKAHPSILLWCGGNELFLARDYGHPGEYCFGEKCVREVFPAVCEVSLSPQMRSVLQLARRARSSSLPIRSSS